MRIRFTGGEQKRGAQQKRTLREPMHSGALYVGSELGAERMGYDI